MSSIQQLSQDSSRLLSSTNIITSVFSVVKELIENSMDSNASSIEVKLENNGLDKIEVRDNGFGIKKCDIPCVAKPHFTSKLQSVADLEQLETYGFRGEALGAVCAVGELSITTKTKEEEISSTYVFDSNGDVKSSKLSASSSGTSVVVTNLFYNLPVRKKYYKYDKHKKDEIKKIEDLLHAYSCAQLETRFALFNNQSLIWSKNATPDMKVALTQVFGLAVVKNLEETKKSYDNKLEIAAFLPRRSVPIYCTSRNTPDRTFIIINKRPVKIKALEKLLQKIYCSSPEDSESKSRYPMGVLQLTIPPAQLDVNVDPNKLKVLLHNFNELLTLIQECLQTVPTAQSPVNSFSYNASNPPVALPAAPGADKRKKPLSSDFKQSNISGETGIMSLEKENFHSIHSNIPLKKPKGTPKLHTDIFQQSKLPFDLPVTETCLQNNSNLSGELDNLLLNTKSSGKSTASVPNSKFVAFQNSLNRSIPTLNVPAQKKSSNDIVNSTRSELTKPPNIYNSGANSEVTQKGDLFQNFRFEDFNLMDMSFPPDVTATCSTKGALPTNRARCENRSSAITLSAAKNTGICVKPFEFMKDSELVDDPPVSNVFDSVLPVKRFDLNMPNRTKDCCVSADNINAVEHVCVERVKSSKNEQVSNVFSELRSDNVMTGKNSSVNSVEVASKTEELNWSRGKVLDKQLDILQPVSVLRPNAPQKRNIDCDFQEMSPTTQKRLKPVSSNKDTIMDCLKTPFDVFCQQRRLEVLAKNPSFSNKEIGCMLLEEWKTLSPDIRQVYVDGVNKQNQKAIVLKKRIDENEKKEANQITLKNKPNKSPNISRKKKSLKPRERVISFDITKLQKVHSKEINRSDTACTIMRPVGCLSDGVWICRDSEELLLLNTNRIRESLLYHRLLDTYQLRSEPLVEPVLVTPELLGSEECYATLLIICMKESSILITNECIVANGFNIKFYKDEYIAEIIGMAANIPSYNFKDLSDILHVAKSFVPAAVPLSKCRPFKVKQYLQGEAERIARQSLLIKTQSEFKDLMIQVNKYLPKSSTCFHNKPFQCKLYDLCDITKEQTKNS